MTSEKAIKILKSKMDGHTDTSYEWAETVRMAIKALKQDPTIRNCFGCKYATDNHNSGTEECHLCMWKNQYTPAPKNNLGVDCISRKQAIDAIPDLPPYMGYKKRAITEILQELPLVTPQPRKGHWIECMPGGAEEWCYKCSECNFWKYKKTINLSKFKFCPNCGSDNSEVKE